MLAVNLARGDEVGIAVHLAVDGQVVRTVPAEKGIDAQGRHKARGIRAHAEGHIGGGIGFNDQLAVLDAGVERRRRDGVAVGVHHIVDGVAHVFQAVLVGVEILNARRGRIKIQHAGGVVLAGGLVVEMKIDVAGLKLVREGQDGLGRAQGLGDVFHALLALRVIQHAQARALAVDAVHFPDQGRGHGVQLVHVAAFHVHVRRLLRLGARKPGDRR